MISKTQSGIQAMVAEREKILERARMLESVPGSGFHAQDKNEVGGALKAPQHQGLNRLSEQFVGFVDWSGRSDVRFVGDDAIKAKAVIDAFMKAIKRDSQRGTDRKLIWMHECGRPELREVDGVHVLLFWGQDWNDWLELFTLSHYGVQLAGGSWPG